MRVTSSHYIKPIICLVLSVGGLAIIAISSLFQNITIPKEQQDFSHFLNYNFTKPVGVVFFMAGLLLGYLSKLNPFKVGACLFAVFPLTTLVESIVDGTSHNLWPFELIMYFIYSLPSILAVYLGRLISSRYS